MIFRAALPALLFALAARLSLAGAPLDDGRRLFDAGNFKEAVSVLRPAAEQAPADGRLQYWLARCYYELSDFDNAVTEAERAVRADPGNSEYHQWLGRACGGKAEQTRSFFLARRVKKEFEEAVRLDGSNISARRDLTDFLIEAPWILGGSKEKARQQAEAISALDPVQGRLALAAVWLGENKIDQAAAEYQRVLAAAPAKVEPYLEIAAFYERRENGDALDRTVDAAAHVNSADPRLGYYRAAARILKGDRLPEAEQLLRSYVVEVPARSDFPSYAAAREWLGRLFEKVGKRNEAAEQYRVAVQLDPGRESARLRLRRVAREEQ